MNIRVIVSFLLFALAIAQAHAHLGDALPVMIARLGTPTIPNGVDDDQTFFGKKCVVARRYFFGSGRYTIDAYIINYLCARIHYSKSRAPNEVWLSNASIWTDIEIKDLLAKNSEGNTWTELPPSQAPIGGLITRRWKRSDGGTATQSSTEFEMISPVYLQAVASAQATSQAESEKAPNL
jgi:hypothetical protein